MRHPLTVFTPTYNRKETLKRTYHSLQSQTCKDFVWLIIDDGSIDDTKTEVAKWQIEKNGFKIQYVYKENGGLHTGYNKAIELMETELCICIDSDDYMPTDGVERILNLWLKEGSSEYAGIVGYDFIIGTDKPIGGDLPAVHDLHIVDLAQKYNHRGDVKLVHRTSLLKEVFPMPTFVGEKNFNPIYLFLKIDMKYPLLLLRENLCFVDYQPDGMAANIFNQYRNSPNSFAELRRVTMCHPKVGLKYKFFQNIHYVANSIIAHDFLFVKKSPKKLLTILSIPFGIILYLYIMCKTTYKNA